MQDDAEEMQRHHDNSMRAMMSGLASHDRSACLKNSFVAWASEAVAAHKARLKAQKHQTGCYYQMCMVNILLKMERHNCEWLMSLCFSSLLYSSDAADH